MKLREIWISAITDADGKTVNAGYLALTVVLLITLGAIPSVLLLAAAKLWMTKEIDFQALAIALGAPPVGFGAAAAALGAFVRGDKA